ncbi:putative endonuclease [Methylophilales phage Melnitz EXVC044M]|nr:flap endonuclease [Methylophilales phage Melnitz-1 EXVC043M]QZI94573.1 putative endonuclease [Methylophilales phage Melnitz-2 EXVC040M]QZI94795.1 putative endonuclease [Methylophilales phage Melnitz EXVC044M]QZI95016.1 flap endonuclease [Methylophilales phage Melnitz-3 EXVC039M]
MILVDMNQVTISNLMMQLGSKRDNELDENLVRHMVLNSIRGYRSRFHDAFGEMVLCYDSKKYWRRDYFPNYKSNRKKDRANSGLDWNTIFETLNNIRDEIKETFPYKVLEVEGAEADDCIAAIVQHVAETPSEFEHILILSGDKDFIQLHKYNNVQQYSPTVKKFIKDINPDIYIREHVLKGDRSDGVPNFLSPDNTFVDELRQKPLTKKKLETWIDLEPTDYCSDEMLRNYQRNKTLIDLECIPSDLKVRILEEYQNAEHGDRSKLLNYFINKRLKNLMNDIGDF